MPVPRLQVQHRRHGAHDPAEEPSEAENVIVQGDSIVLG